MNNETDDTRRDKRRAFIRQGLLAASILAASPIRLLPQGFGDACAPTTLDFFGLGPFYKANAPFRHVIAATDEPGTRLFITGIVYANDCITPLPGVVVDVWHADNEGRYSSTTDPEDFRLRARLRSATNGAFAFETVKPGFYLNGSQYRPSHIHLRTRHLAEPELITQLYFEGDPYISIDPAASEPGAAARIIPLQQAPSGMHGVFDIILDVPPPASGTPEDAYETGQTWLRQNHPNPVSGSTTIPIHIAQRTAIDLAVYDLLGGRVRTLLTGTQDRGAQTVLWDGCDERGNRLASGAYVCRLVAGKEILTRIMTVQ